MTETIMQGTQIIEQKCFDAFNAACDRGEYVKVRDLAKDINIRESLIYYHIAQGNLPSVRVGGKKGHIWIAVAAIQDFREQYNK